MYVSSQDLRSSGCEWTYFARGAIGGNGAVIDAYFVAIPPLLLLACALPGPDLCRDVSKSRRSEVMKRFVMDDENVIVLVDCREIASKKCRIPSSLAEIKTSPDAFSAKADTKRLCIAPLIVVMPSPPSMVLSRPPRADVPRLVASAPEAARTLRSTRITLPSLHPT